MVRQPWQLHHQSWRLVPHWAGPPANQPAHSIQQCFQNLRLHADPLSVVQPGEPSLSTCHNKADGMWYVHANCCLTCWLGEACATVTDCCVVALALCVHIVVISACCCPSFICAAYFRCMAATAALYRCVGHSNLCNQHAYSDIFGASETNHASFCHRQGQGACGRKWLFLVEKETLPAGASFQSFHNFDHSSLLHRVWHHLSLPV